MFQHRRYEFVEGAGKNRPGDLGDVAGFSSGVHLEADPLVRLVDRSTGTEVALFEAGEGAFHKCLQSTNHPDDDQADASSGMSVDDQISASQHKSRVEHSMDHERILLTIAHLHSLPLNVSR
jgi:hypothetical protein